MISDKDHLPLVIVASPEDEGKFKKASHNPYLVTDKSVEIDADVKNAGDNAKEIAQKIHDQFVADGEKNVKDQYEKADGAKKTTDDLDKIMTDAIDDDRIANLLIQQGAYIKPKTSPQLGQSHFMPGAKIGYEGFNDDQLDGGNGKRKPTEPTDKRTQFISINCFRFRRRCIHPA